jgi:hypothetical protein
MPRQNKLLEMMQGAAPAGTDPMQTGPVGSPMPGPEDLEGAEPRVAEGPEGDSAAQSAILQAIASQGQPDGAEGPQLTPEMEEIIRQKLALAARQKLLEGSAPIA